MAAGQAARRCDGADALASLLRHAGIELQHRGGGGQCCVRHRGVAFGAGMHRAAIDRRQHAPGRVMDVGRLLRGR